MRGGWLVAAAILAATAGCIGAMEDDEVAPAQASEAGAEAVDYTQPAQTEATRAPTERPTAEVSPRSSGEHSVEEREYDFGRTVVSDSEAGNTYPARLNGTVTYPSQPDGPHPVVVLLHGRHTTCKVLEGPHVLGTSACPNAEPVSRSIPNWQGYTYMAETLASNGFVVVSVNANDANDRDAAYQRTSEDTPVVGEHYIADLGVRARAQLVLRTLDGVEQVHRGQDPAPVVGDNEALVEALEGQLDLDGVGLVGHSRGGDGVSYAVPYNEERTQGQPHDLAAVFALAPTNFRYTTVTGVPYGVLLPYCDGDVFNLQGAEIYDDSRYLDDAGPLYQYVAMGANHNFYNTVWTDHFDDASGYEDPFCGPSREDGGGQLSPAAQRAHGEALVNAFLTAHVAGEERFEPLLEGRERLPAGACPDGTDPCPGLIHTSYHPPSDERLVVESVADGEATDTNDLGGEVHTEGAVEASVCDPADCPSTPNRQTATQLTLEWTDTGRYVLEVPDQHRDLSGYDRLSLRVGVNFDDPANQDRGFQDVSIQLTDEANETTSVPASAYSHALYVPAGTTGDGVGSAEVTLSAVSVPLDAFDGVAETRADAIALVTDRTPAGSIQLADVMLQR